MNIMQSLGVRIKEARKEKEITQTELAGSNISRSLLSLIENGNAKPSLTTLQYIAGRLDKPISYFLMSSQNQQQDLDSIISNLEHLYQNKQYTTIITSSNAFLKENADHLDSFTKIGKLYSILGISYSNIGNQQALFYLTKAIENLETKEESYLSQCYYHLGTIMWDNKDYKMMKYYLSLANNLAKNISLDNLHLKLNILYNLSLSLYNLQEYNSVIEKINEALDYSKKYELYYNFGYFCMLLALTYKLKNNTDQAIIFNNKAIKYYVLSDNEYMKYTCYINQTSLLRINKDYNESLILIEEAISYFQSINDNAKLANAKTEKLKTLFFSQENSDMLANFGKKILESIVENNECRGEVICILGGIAIENKEYVLALTLLLEAETLLLEYEKNDMRVYLYKWLNNVYEHNNDLESAYKYLLRAATLVDSNKPTYESTGVSSLE